MAISERIHFFRLMRGMTQSISVQQSVFQKRVLMCVWHSTKLVHANRKQTLQMHWHRCLMFLHRLLMFLT